MKTLPRSRLLPAAVAALSTPSSHPPTYSPSPPGLFSLLSDPASILPQPPGGKSQLPPIPSLPPAPRPAMTWTITLSRATNSKSHYTASIRALNTALIESDPTLANLLASSNVKFADFIASIRKLVENAYPEPSRRPKHINELLANTNWANHGEKNTKFKSTTVDVDHCDAMVALFTDFVDNYTPGTQSDNDSDNDSGSDDVSGLTTAMALAAIEAPGTRACKKCSHVFKTNFQGKAPVCSRCPQTK